MTKEREEAGKGTLFGITAEEEDVGKQETGRDEPNVS